MKISTKRRLLSLLLALIMVLSMAPTALLSNSGGTDTGTGDGTVTDPDKPGPGDPDEPVTGVLEDLKLSSDSFDPSQTAPPNYAITLEPNSSVDRGGARITATLDPVTDTEVQKLHVTWSPTNSPIVGVSEQDNGHVGNIWGKSPGEETIRVTAGTGEDKKECTIKAVVSGIKLSETLASGIEVQENGTVKIDVDTDYTLFGNAAAESAVLTASVVNNKSNVYLLVQGKSVTIEGRQEGSATVRLSISAAGRIYEAEFPVTVTSNLAIIPYTEGCSPSKPLRFSELEELIAAACQEKTGQTLTSVTGLSVPTAQGTLYLGYNSPEDTGAGAGSSVTYYTRTSLRGPYIQDLTFVPNPSYTKEKAYISFTGQAVSDSGTNRSFKGRIEVTLTQEKTDLTVSTKRDTPLELTSSLFSKTCHEQTGSPLGYVIFTLPPTSQGTLYLDYRDEWNYAAKVSPNEQYAPKQLDTITFVPAEGYVGTVRIGYAGYSVSGVKYNGELVIQVKQGLDDAITYNDNGGGLVSFDRGDFEDFCENATGKALSAISFTLPPASQGVLYLNWNGARGTAAAEGWEYGAAQLDRMSFVSAEGFNGVVRIPFSGTSRSGLTFAGTVELHIQTTGSGTGDITYICAPGQSVKLSLSDFSGFCQSVTGQRLHYISFQSLPDFNQGSLYHNRTSSGSMGTRATTSTRYFNSATPYIANLSFWAAGGFSRVDIPFTGASVNGQSFTGVLTITSGAGAGSGQPGAVTYTAVGQTLVPFSGSDFDAACRQATNAALSYLQFALPSSGQGILYYDYRAGTAPTSLDPGATLYRSGETSVDRVTFVAAKGFSGVATVPFTGWAIDGRQFQGTVQITVRADAALGGLVRYESWGEPVHLNAYDIQTASGGTPVSLRLTGLPEAGSGKLYYQYNGPTQYSWQGNTSTIYSLYGDPTVSSLTFVPKAGFYGEVSIPYTASNGDGTQYNGTIRITVSEPAASANFDDLGGYSAQMKSAVDYLYNLNVVKGTGDRRYEPGKSIRRGDFCVMLSRAFQFNVGSSVQGFSDVAPESYYAQAVNDMYALGIVAGVGGGKFEPSSTLTRQDAALMVQRALNQAGISVPDGNAAALASYSDQSRVADYAQGAVSGLVQQGLLPTSGGRISPRSDLNRGDMAILLHRAMTK